MMQKQRFHHRNTLPALYGVGGLLLLSANTLYARDFYFQPQSLEGGENAPQAADLAIFANPKAQLAGSYPSHILLNNKKIQDHTLTYVNTDDGTLVPLLTPKMLQDWGVKVDDYPELAAEPADTPLKQELGHYIPLASAQFDFRQQNLNLSIPQAALIARENNDIGPSRWDTGVPVGFVDYSFSGQQNESSGQKSLNSQYLNLRSGVNLGGWRLRNYGTWSGTDGDAGWQNIASWVQHDIQVLKAQFLAGESSTRGEIFDSIQFSGINVASDDDMLPGRERGYAPVIRGTAYTNAVVTVKQNGYTLYQQNVAPGAFEINDLTVSTNSDDLEVSVQEADGSVHTTTQTFSSIALMQRPSHLRFEATVGRYRANSGSTDKEPEFAQGSAIYGINNQVTAFGGFTTAENYNAIASGIGIGLGVWGAVSTDITVAHTELDTGESDTGQSWRVLYSTDIEPTNTHLSFSGYRYSSKGFYSFAEANQRYSDDDNSNDRADHKRNRLQVNLSQQVGTANFYLNGYEQNYWNNHRRDRSLSAGANYSLQGISYNLSLTWSHSGSSEDDRALYLGITVPLSRWLSNSWASYGLNNSQHGATTQNVGLNGSLLADNSLSYSLQQSHSTQTPENSSSLYGTWYAQYGRLNAGYYTATDGTRQLSYGATGAVVAHPHGITLAQPLGNQFAIIDTDGAPGISFENQRGIRTDWFGNAIIPSLSAYSENRIGVKTDELPEDVDSDNTATTVVPTRNAAVAAHFNARRGYRALITLMQSSGKTVPFGAVVTSSDGLSNGIVDDQGTVYLAGLGDSVTLHVKWGSEQQQRCSVLITANNDESLSGDAAGIKRIRTVCNQGG
ncbi:fimbria/pilus outer membrane usher protein [Kluyvera genomosp. 1]|uniref:fimbria/pilus outer membrane usher protein n=1 Tax=Kluyvera genomosp. 1 TaxID=2774053 RepID=UPI000ADB8860|nr:fimbria/pilus outer membrane usher protein [Kluyvera genomosp. 1]